MTVNRFLMGSRFVVTSLFCVLPVDTFANNKEDKRADIQKMSRDTLHRLYKAEPPAKAAVEKAYGYAVFSNTSGNGIGMAVNNKTKGKTFMRMFEIHEDPGAGSQEVSVRLCIRQRESVQRLREFWLGVRRAEYRREFPTASGCISSLAREWF